MAPKTSPCAVRWKEHQAARSHQRTIGAQANIKAEISAKAVVITGAVTGNVMAADKVEIQATGSVTGDVVSPRLVIADGGCLNGNVKMPQSERGHTPPAKPSLNG